jgi:hypothetical protein
MGNKPSANFQKDLQAGLLGQKAFAKLFTHLVETDGKSGDFTTPDGAKVEVKTDMYAMTKTANFFMERFSSVEVGSPGGPWQALKHECEYFVYWYAADSTGFVWRTADLVKQLDVIIGQLKPVEVRNRRWTTVGFKVPRAALIPLATFNNKECMDAAGTTVTWGFAGSTYIAGSLTAKRNL